MKLEQTKSVFSQENDTCDEGDFGQYLSVETHDGGGGVYITISTERWALDKESVPEFVAKLLGILESFESGSEPTAGAAAPAGETEEQNAN